LLFLRISFAWGELGYIDYNILLFRVNGESFFVAKVRNSIYAELFAVALAKVDLKIAEPNGIDGWHKVGVIFACFFAGLLVHDYLCVDC
jgi:hypothetical protein